MKEKKNNQGAGIVPVIYTAKVCQDEKNTKYPISREITCLSDLEDSARRDNMPAKCRNNHRGKEDYESENMVIMDLDNDHSEDEEDWYSTDDIAETFPDVKFYVIFSRNHMKPKKKDDVIHEARPKIHFYLPLKNQNTDYDSASMFRIKLLCLFPAFDIKCADPVHFMYGVPDAHGEVYEGSLYIDEFIDQVDKNTPELYEQRLIEHWEKYDSEAEHKRIKSLFDSIGSSYLGVSSDSTDEESGDKEQFLEGFFQKYGITYKKGKSGAVIQYSVKCPWSDNHTSGDDTAKVSILKNGKLGYKCHHDHCNGRHWKDFRSYYDPEYRKKCELDRFHILNNQGEPIGTLDDVIAEDIIHSQPMINYQGILYLYHDGWYEADEDKPKVKEMISQRLYLKFRRAQNLAQIHNLILTKTAIIKREEDLNAFPAYWINFQNGMLDVKTMRIHEHDPKYISLNQIPHLWIDKEPGEDSIVCVYLKDLLKDPKDLEMFLQYCGYCMTYDTSQQVFMILHGNGGTGKSVLLRMLSRAIGQKNIGNISLQALNKNRFASYFLSGKLANIYADLPSKDMSDIDTLKIMTGEDTATAEIKNGKIFGFHPYCKLLFSANKIPKSRDDKTDAYYRRLRILTVNHRAKEIPDLEEKLADDIQSFIWLCVHAVHRMYESGKIIESDNSTRETAQLYADTDSVQAFITDCGYIVTGDPADRVNRKDLYHEYERYCEDEGRTQSLYTPNGFYSNLRDKGCIIRENFRMPGTGNVRAVAGIKKDLSEIDIPFN